MVTRNFKRLLARMLQSTGNDNESNINIVTPFVLVDTGGSPFYLVSRSNQFPYSTDLVGQNSSTDAGISVGSGGTAPSETDYCLETPISNVNVVVNNMSMKNDKYYNNTLIFNVGVTNQGSSDIVIREICYKTVLRGTAYVGRLSTTFSGTSCTCMLDRAVLDSPITIPPGETGIIIYRLSTSIYGERTIDGIPIVSFDRGTDEEICAMIDAAKQGKFDLQKDCGWSVGEHRRIHIDAFTGGGSTTHAAQDLDIVITSFDDYNGCGCLFQFDSVQALSTTQRMNGSSQNNYANSEMVNTTLPALEAALPSWLKSRLTAFDVLYKASYNATEISTLAGQKLGIRSATEVRNASVTPPDGAYMGYFTNSSHRGVSLGISDNTTSFVTRTPTTSNTYYMVSNSSTNRSATAAGGVAFFGCI